MDDPERYREFLDRLIATSPELFPPEIGRGYRMKDTYRSRKTGWRLRRIELRDGEKYCMGLPLSACLAVRSTHR